MIRGWWSVWYSPGGPGSTDENIIGHDKRFDSSPPTVLALVARIGPEFPSVLI
jgi:hypothetical protein